MINIDGSQGEGGGQIIRSSLALSALTGQAIRLDNIRAGRKKPGLLRQHLTGVRATAEICGAEIDGVELGAMTLTFQPNQIRGGDYRFQIGSAGSACLVAQTVLPALMMSDAPSTVTIEGGTHNEWAPPFDFLSRVFLPQLAKMGPRVKASISRQGFYPAGGGEISLEITPANTLRALNLTTIEGKPEPRVTAIVSKLPSSIGERQCSTIRRKAQWSEKCCHVIEVKDPVGPGNVVMIEWIADNVSELFTGFGKVGVKAEQIARGVYREMREHLNRGVPVGEYLADQLMMPMGVAASQGRRSEMLTGPLSLHSKTHIDILQLLLPIEINVIDEGDDAFRVVFEESNEAT